MAKYYEATEKKNVTDSGGATHNVEDAIDLAKIKITLEKTKPKTEELRATLDKLESLLFDAAGTPKPGLKDSKTARGSLIKVYFSTKEALAELQDEFEAGVLSGSNPAAVKNPDVQLFENSMEEIYNLLETYTQQVEPFFTQDEKIKLGLVQSFAQEEGGGKELAKSDVEGLLKKWFVKDIVANDELRYTAEALIEEKLSELKPRFIEQAIIVGETAVEGEQRWKDFHELVWDTYHLTDYGIMRADSINPIQGTAKHEVLFPPPEEHKLAPTNKPGAMEKNTKFNLNPIVGSANLDMSEQFVAGMGVVQMLCFAAYQEMKSNTSPYTRNLGFEADKMDRLLEEVSKRNRVHMWDGSRRNYRVKNELEKFPLEVRSLLKTIAKWKLSRDDLGSQAAIWHLGRNKGAFKYSDGASGRPAGLLAAMCYQIGKNSKFENHLAAANFMTPERTELMNLSAPGGPPNPDEHANDIDIAQAIEQVDRFEIFKDPQMIGKMYNVDPATGKPTALHKYEPTHWWQDFPELSQFFNQTENVLTGADYIKARDAVLKIIETAARSPLITLDTNATQMEEKIKAVLQNFNTEIGKAIAYVGPYNDGSELYNKGAVLPDKVNQKNYVNELILAAYKYFISNILEAVPSKNLVPIWDVARLTLWDYDDRYKRAVSIIEDIINRNSTLAPYYRAHLTGKMPIMPAGVVVAPPAPTPFVQLDFKKVWRDIPKLENGYKSWILKNVNRYKGLGTRQRIQFMNESPHNPINQGEGWTSSYEDPRYERTT